MIENKKSKKATKIKSVKSKAIKIETKPEAEAVDTIETAIKCEDVENKFLHVKVGNENRPASDEDINTVQAQIEELLTDHDIRCLVYVSHHAVDIRVVK